MQYIKVVFEISEQEVSDMLMALLADIGYDGFEEAGKELYAYISEDSFDAAELTNISTALKVSCRTEIIPAQNWNALWESNFQPVIVDGFCTIRAHFHNLVVETPYDIQITPKMSFGTGHHATTQLMMLQMKDMDLAGKSVLDFGTGTGVLAILAEMLGAATVEAIDNDEWSVENAGENIERNNCRKIRIQQGSIEATAGKSYDIILANINRHILLQYMPDLYRQLHHTGHILMSGLLVEDKQTIQEAAELQGFHFEQVTEQNNWISLLFHKK